MAPFDMTAMNEGNTGLTLPYDEWSERASGSLRAQNEANFAVAGLYCPRSDIDYTMQFILQHTDGANLLTKDALSYLKNSVEAHIVTDAAWPGLCVLLYDGECEVAPLMGIPTPYGTYDITDEHGCLQMTSPAYYFAKYGDADFDDIEGTISRIRSGSPTDWNTFVSLMGSDFDPDAGSPPSTSYLKSMAFLGLPFHNWTACACATVAHPPPPPRFFSPEPVSPRCADVDDDEQSHLAPLVTAGKYLYYTDEYRLQESESLDATIEHARCPGSRRRTRKPRTSSPSRSAATASSTR